MIAEAIAEEDELFVLRDRCAARARRMTARGSNCFDLRRRDPRRHILQGAHRLVDAEDVGGAVDHLRPAAGEHGRDQSAAELFGFFVERADGDAGMLALEDFDPRLEDGAILGPHLMPEVDRTARIVVAQRSRSDARKQPCERASATMQSQPCGELRAARRSHFTRSARTTPPTCAGHVTDRCTVRDRLARWLRRRCSRRRRRPRARSASFGKLPANVLVAAIERDEHLLAVELAAKGKELRVVVARRRSTNCRGAGRGCSCRRAMASR